jgi:hypothetical protein
MMQPDRTEGTAPEHVYSPEAVVNIGDRYGTKLACTAGMSQIPNDYAKRTYCAITQNTKVSLIGELAYRSGRKMNYAYWGL